MVLCLNLLVALPSSSVASRMLPGFASLHGSPALGAFLPQSTSISLNAKQHAQRWHRCVGTRSIRAQLEQEDGGERVSVTGPVYTSKESSSPRVTLYTKFQCTLCDKVKDVLAEVKPGRDHALDAVDITDPEHQEWWDRYKYDIPVLHVNGKYWTKHRLSAEEATAALDEAASGAWKERKGQPNAAAMEKS